MRIEKRKKLQPFIKWVGGKRGLLSQILPLFPKNFDNFFEPFVGGGAVFFEMFSNGTLADKEIYLFDINKELINTYQVVKNRHQELIEKLEEFKSKHSKEFYYEVRSWDKLDNFQEMDSIIKAARFIYLNKTCFNGLYRVNKKGFFNTPIGSYKNPNIADIKSIKNANCALQNCTIENYDFAEVLKYAKKGDFIYFDPPYYPLNTTSKFTSYSEFEFLEKEQERLFEVFYELDKRGCFVALSNSDTKFIKDLYKNFDINFINANRFINSKSNGRGKISEVLVRNY